ncbi:MAG TPA: hypothetical protein VNQ78_05200 [Paracoccus sp. (in: a-proteobacteria)]|uniref:hypothetical protein n=1 Tax=Paracoccus sp. TaxID=267 RepID=UPI002B668486|nr:hypothetical protein [Paracoccus sp. (in: a-proteobacteria)]HWL56058.1 hypothetical protein [Paracoccus sp. (in: a-proteobacteria)]
MSRNIVLGLLPVLLIAACGTPQERCISRNTNEYRAVSRLLAEVEGNLARGYAWEERQTVRTEWDQCYYRYRNRDGGWYTGYRPCLRDVTDTERYRVPIDPAAEARKRDNLVARKQALAPAARGAVAACKTAYPEAEKP